MSDKSKNFSQQPEGKAQMVDTPLIIDEEFAALIPALQPQERELLEANLLADGCRDPLVVWQTDGKAVLLDGHNRFAICTQHDIPFTTVAAEVTDRDSALLWMIRHQLGRRNLRNFDRATLALRLKPLLAEQAKVNSLANLKQGNEKPDYQNSDSRGATLPLLAETAGISHDTLARVEYITEHAPDAVRESARTGDLSVNRAYQLTKALETAPAPVVDFVTRTGLDDVDTVRLFAEGAKAGRDWWDDIQHTGYIQLGDEEEAVAWDAGALALKAAIEAKKKVHAQLVMDERRAAREQAAQDTPCTDVLALGDARQLAATLHPQSVRLLLTDPPYGMDFQSNRRVVTPQAERIAGDDTIDAALDLFEETLTALDFALKPECHLLVFTGWRYEPEFRRLLEGMGFEVCASLVWVKENHTSGDLNGFAPKHERILHARRGKAAISPRVADVLMYARENASDHPTEKPTALLSTLIECTTVHGELVLDPFAGSASTLVAAIKSGRRAIGFELSADWYAQGLERINAR